MTDFCAIRMRVDEVDRRFVLWHLLVAKVTGVPPFERGKREVGLAPLTPPEPRWPDRALAGLAVTRSAHSAHSHSLLIIISDCAGRALAPLVAARHTIDNTSNTF